MITDGTVDWSRVEAFVEELGFNPAFVKSIEILRGYITIEHFVPTTETSVLATQDGKFISYTIILESV